MKNKGILVTGAAGFIGSHVSQKLLDLGETVIGLDELNDYYPVLNKKRNLSLLSSYPNFSFIRADIRSLEQCEEALQGIKITKIAHIAARAGVRPSIKDPFLYESVNVNGTLNILEIGKKHEVENFVLTSSSSVYGNSTNIPFKEDDSATDRPISPYAATKKASEAIGYTYHHLYNMPVTVIRPFTVYGPRGRPDMAPWLFLESCIKGNSINKFGEGLTRRDYTYIDDFVSGFVSALQIPLGFEIINLGNSATVSLNEAIATIEKIVGNKLIINQLSPQPGDVDLTNAYIEKAREKLGYNPVTSFEEGMTKFHLWYKETYLS